MNIGLQPHPPTRFFIEEEVAGGGGHLRLLQTALVAVNSWGAGIKHRVVNCSESQSCFRHSKRTRSAAE